MPARPSPAGLVRACLLTAAGFLAAAVLPAQEGATQAPPPADSGEQPPRPRAEETIVVTASRTEQALGHAPAALTVLDARTLESLPAANYGDLLRNVPGLNVSQTSARDFNMTSRASTTTMATSQLVLLDGRSIYLDFFGFVMWDFLPIDPGELKQIEAVRGPGSAVWGANAMTGVINLITRRPHEMVGTRLSAGAGQRGTLNASATHAGVRGDLGYKVSAGYSEQDPYERPTGVIPGSNPPTFYPEFENPGTAQPKADVRVDRDLGGGSSNLSAAAGYARTAGILHTPTGPYAVVGGSSLGYGKVDWNRSGLHLGFYANLLDGNAINQLTLDANGQRLSSKYITNTYNLEASNVSVVGRRHVLTYGANFRTSEFELEIAPLARRKREWGAFLQGEILIGGKARWLVGSRYDHVDPLDHGVFSPRTSLLLTPWPNHTVRLSYNQAFRSPSALQSYIDQDILQQVGPLLLPAHAGGSTALDEERLTAYEIGYVGTLGNGLSLSFAAYRNVTTGSIDFYISRLYGPGNLPGPPHVPEQLVPCFLFTAGAGPEGCPLRGMAGLIPSNYDHRNIGRTSDRGVELAVQQRLGRRWAWFLNASWQDRPEFEGVDAASQNRPPQYRANAGLSFDDGRVFWSVSGNHQGEAYWADVLFARGVTEAFTRANASLGVRLLGERLTLQLTGTNVFDERIQEHIFGDIISRTVTGEAVLRF